MTPGERLSGLLPWALACFALAGIVHIASVLLMPRLAPRDAYTRLAAFIAQGGLRPLPAAEPGQEILPFLDPAFAYAVCGYDLARGPLRIRAAVVPGPFVSMSFRSRKGQLFYSLTDRAASRGKIDIVVLTTAQLAEAEAQDSDDEPVQELRLLAPELQGFVLLRSLAGAQSELPLVDANVLKALPTIMASVLNALLELSGAQLLQNAFMSAARTQLLTLLLMPVNVLQVMD